MARYLGPPDDVAFNLSLVRRSLSTLEAALKHGGEHDTLDASVVATDPELDLAALQLTATDLPCMVLGDSDAVVVGQRVKVVGFPFGRDVEVGGPPAAEVVPDPSVTAGTLSAARSDEEGQTRYLQTDASVHAGSSGGPSDSNLPSEAPGTNPRL